MSDFYLRSKVMMHIQIIEVSIKINPLVSKILEDSSLSVELLLW